MTMRFSWLSSKNQSMNSIAIQLSATPYICFSLMYNKHLYPFGVHWFESLWLWYSLALFVFGRCSFVVRIMVRVQIQLNQHFECGVNCYFWHRNEWDGITFQIMIVMQLAINKKNEEKTLNGHWTTLGNFHIEHHIVEITFILLFIQFLPSFADYSNWITFLLLQMQYVWFFANFRIVMNVKFHFNVHCSVKVTSRLTCFHFIPSGIGCNIVEKMTFLTSRSKVVCARSTWIVFDLKSGASRMITKISSDKRLISSSVSILECSKCTS